MKFSKPKFESPVVGCGVVKLGKTTFTVDITTKTDTEKFTFKLDELPEDLPEGWALKNGKEYFLNVRADGSAINSIRPAKGTFTVICTGVVKDDDDTYLSIEKSGEYGKYWNSVVNLEVVEGDNEGIVFPLYIPLASSDKKGNKLPKFIDDGHGFITISGDPTKSKGRSLPNLFDLIEYSGLSEVEIPYPEDEDEQTILAAFSKALRKGKKRFMLIAEKGYVKSMASLDESEEVADEVEDDPAPAKKVAKKVIDMGNGFGKVVDDDEEVKEEPVAKKKVVSKHKFEDD